MRRRVHFMSEQNPAIVESFNHALIDEIMFRRTPLEWPSMPESETDPQAKRRHSDSSTPSEEADEASEADLLGIYSRYYSFDAIGEHYCGHLVGRQLLFANLFVPQIDVPRGTVLVLHGYLDHSGTFGPLFRHLIEQGYCVLAVDLPGHGLSGGERGGIDDFATYADALDMIVERMRGQLPGPYACIGHSTGGASLIEYLFHKRSPFGAHLLVAPLVRSIAWHASRIGFKLFHRYVAGVPRTFQRVSHNKAFLEFARRDPLQLRIIPNSWLRSLYAWNERIVRYPMAMASIDVIQGTHDQVVSWRYNLRFLQEKFVQCQVTLVRDRDCNHVLYNENPPIQQRVLHWTSQCLARSLSATTNSV